MKLRFLFLLLPSCSIAWLNLRSFFLLLLLVAHHLAPQIKIMLTAKRITSGKRLGLQRNFSPFLLSLAELTASPTIFVLGRLKTCLLQAGVPSFGQRSEALAAM